MNYEKEEKMREKIRQYLLKINGIDELFNLMFILYFVIYIINLFIKSAILEAIGLIIFLIMFYRFMSTNKAKRKKENDKYLKMKNRIIGYFKDDCIYKKCSKCKTVLKLPLPYKRGIKHAKCPTCGKRLTILCLKYQKIEVIRKKW